MPKKCQINEYSDEREEGAASAFKVIFKDMTRKLRIDGFCVVVSSLAVSLFLNLQFQELGLSRFVS